MAWWHHDFIVIYNYGVPEVEISLFKISLELRISLEPHLEIS